MGGAGVETGGGAALALGAAAPTADRAAAEPAEAEAQAAAAEGSWVFDCFALASAASFLFRCDQHHKSATNASNNQMNCAGSNF